MLDKGIPINRQDKFRNQQIVLTIAVPMGKRIFINDNVGWGRDVDVNIGHDNDYWNWDDNDSPSLQWDHNVEYVMTATGLQRTDNATIDEGGDNEGDNSNETIEQFRKSKEQMEKEKEQKLKELQEIDKELQRSADSTRYHYQQSAPDSVVLPKPKKTKEPAKNTAVAEVPASLNDLLFIKFAL